MLFRKKHTVFVKNFGVYIEVKHGSNLYKVLREHNLLEEKLCNGDGQCGKCRVRVEGKNLQKPTKHEKRNLSETTLGDGIRLACHYVVKGDITVESVIENYEDPCILSVNFNTKKIEADDDQIIETVDIDSLPNDQLINNYEESDYISEPVLTNNFSDEIIIDESITDDEINDEENVADYSINESVETFVDEVTQEIDAAYKNDIIEETEVIYVDDEYFLEDEEDIVAQTAEIPITKVENNIFPVFEENLQEDYFTDGLILVQLPLGVHYYHYSAPIDTIASKGFIKTDERLENILDENQISDFIYQHVKLKDIERVIVILDKNIFEGEIIFNLINYTSLTLGTLLCEIVQPKGNISDIVRFLRFIVQTGGSRLIIPLDMMERAYFFNDGVITSLDASDPEIAFDLNQIKLDGKNPIISVDDDFSDCIVKDYYYPADSISFSALFRTVSQIYKKKLTDNKLKLINRNDLDGKVPLEQLVKISKRDGELVFNVFRKNGADIYISQAVLDAIHKLRVFTRAAIIFAEKTFGHYDNVVFYTVNKCERLSDDLQALGMIPDEYVNKIKTFYGDPNIAAASFFKERDIKTYISKRLKMNNKYELFENSEFQQLYSRAEIDINR